MTDQKECWIKAQVDAGHYTNDSEYIRDRIRRELERSAELEAIRTALVDGESSGEPRPFNADEFKRKVLAAHG